ncbi:hypothetical protein DLM_1447 [Aquitalea magnusonii]|uniref:Antibiotic biosynthesis monooxygenase n=1 Tax=Aquitalea magnusonii TaxID=332411 RepID=A0A3G9GFP8_9NEIS|nr:hypothetical protein [Aquitalea magnusonii]BBF85071.1 hypothetical protein DLM_1447 [Aquitalea magnusonii]
MSQHPSRPPCWAVVFSAPAGPADMAGRMLRLAQLQAGYLGADPVQDSNGTAVARCYWDDVDAIAAWRVHAEHLLARESGRQSRVQFSLQVDRVDRGRSPDA